MADLLLELFSEEIPARMQAAALEHLQKTLAATLAAEGIAVPPGNITGYVTPRRLAVWVKHLPAAQAASETEIRGPKEGAPDAALQGFLKKNGLTPDRLTLRDGAYFAVLRREGRQTATLLKPLIEDMLASFPWPKSMRWGAGSASWVRPLHALLCLFDGQVIPVTFAGLTAGATTRGHRFLSPGALTVSQAGAYEAALEDAHVIPSRGKRRACILAGAHRAAAAAGLKLREDEGLLEEVTGLVEWPVLLTGRMDASYMDLPKEVLISEMRAHQKYFALENADGSLAATFLITANITAADGGRAIIAGNERVLRARLADGRFFWDQDRKKPLADWAEGLKSVTFHARLGTLADKVERLSALAARLAAAVPGAQEASVEKAARLCKADLTTGMVGEFPELQGVMGRYYALDAQEDPAVADAIRDHYRPQGPSDAVPAEPTAICVALADKLDTLISLFAIGEKPTGSKDPYALRRAALGVIRIILDNHLRLRLSAFVNAELQEFMLDRLKVQLRDRGIRHDVINAVIAGGDDDLLRIVARARALQDFLETADGTNLLAGYRRAANILAIEEKKDGVSYRAAGLNAAALTETRETQLAGLLPQARERLSDLVAREQFAEAMKHIASLRAPIDDFFEHIMVNCTDRELRVNRLRLLSAIRESVDGIADFSRIEGDSGEAGKKAA